MKKKSDKISIFIKFIKNIHVINNLKTNLLININIFGFENVIIDISKKKIIFIKCENVIVFIQIIARNNIRIRKIVRSKRK